MTQWSMLQKEIEKLFVKELMLKIHCRCYRMASQRGSTEIPRYWIALGKNIIWDYPKDFKERVRQAQYPYITDVSAISRLIREYIDTPVEELLTRQFEDPWDLVWILRAADRRIGKRKLEVLQHQFIHSAPQEVIKARLGFNCSLLSSCNDEKM